MTDLLQLMIASQKSDTFVSIIEVVPPAGHNAEPLLTALSSLQGLPFDAFSVATNPLAKPRMSALALSRLIRERVEKPAILHCTVRDHNRLSIQGLLWGARALGIDTVLVAAGDFVALGERAQTTTVRDVNIFELVELARESGLQTGVVLDPTPGGSGFRQAVRRLERKVKAGAQFVVTQPIYDEAGAEVLREATGDLEIPVIMGILPLRTARHAEFLHQRVAGIVVPERVRERLTEADDALAEGIANGREMLALAKKLFAGACIMPPFGHYEVVSELL